MNLLGSTRNRTTAYHPQANGMVERFHRHLKAGLKARLAGSNWINELPVVLLGIRASLKEGLSCTSAELVYGTTLRLPRDFFSNPVVEDPSSFVSRLHHSVQRQQFIPTQWHGSPSTYLPPDLHTASHVYVWCDAYKPPLTHPYDGPFRVLRRSDKLFTLEVNGKTREFTVDRLKPPKLDTDQAPLASSPSVSTPHHPAVSTLPSAPTMTQTGRRIRRPAHLHDYVTNW